MQDSYMYVLVKCCEIISLGICHLFCICSENNMSCSSWDAPLISHYRYLVEVVPVTWWISQSVVTPTKCYGNHFFLIQWKTLWKGFASKLLASLQSQCKKLLEISITVTVPTCKKLETQTNVWYDSSLFKQQNQILLHHCGLMRARPKLIHSWFIGNLAMTVEWNNHTS